jgi:hypothetical protein
MACTERSETRHHAVAAYGLESKKDLVNAIRKYCQYVEACGKGPVRYARCDATSMVSRGWRLDGGVRSGMCRAQLKFSPPPQRTSAPTTWRSWQTLSHRMCAMMLNQDNLARTWFAFLLAACTYDNAVCHGDATATPRAHVWMEARPRTLRKVLPRSAVCRTGPQGTSSSVLPCARAI